jgi:DNA polymerase-1
MRKGINDTILYDTDAVRERYGFGPEHVVDYKALRGDPSDNIIGIKGIGEKTATEIIVKFGSIEHLYEIIEKDPDVLKKSAIKPRVIELLINGKQDALFSKDLATIRSDAPIDFVLPASEWTLADHITLIESLCDELEFKSLKERVRVAVHINMPKKEESPMIDVDHQQLAEVSIALWLLNSDIANPNIQDILDYAHTDDFEQARTIVFEKLRITGRLQEVYERIEHPLISVIERMNASGVGVDVKRLKALSKEYTKGLAEIATRIYRHAGHEFNINSPKQLGVVLYDELQIGSGAKQRKTATGARTTKESELEKLSGAHPIIDDVLAHRELQKLLSTYIDKLPALVAKDGRLHAEFISAGAMTGRMTSKEPNLQNIPVKSEYGRRIREAFVAEKGNMLVAIDYSQIELRIAAGLSNDKELVRIFKAGEDVHTATAAQVFGVPPEKVDKEMRRRAKVINFGILYGMGVNALRANLGNVSRDESSQYLEEYFKKFADLAQWIADTKASAEKNGYTETLYGRRRYFVGFKSSMSGLRAQAERMAVNAPIQGTQADIIKLAMIAADNLIEQKGWRDSVRLVLQVHDELVYEIEKSIVDEASVVLKHAMEDVVAKDMLSGVPIIADVSVGESWGEIKKLV